MNSQLFNLFIDPLLFPMLDTNWDDYLISETSTHSNALRIAQDIIRRLTVVISS